MCKVARRFAQATPPLGFHTRLGAAAMSLWSFASTAVNFVVAKVWYCPPASAATAVRQDALLSARGSAEFR